MRQSSTTRPARAGRPFTAALLAGLTCLAAMGTAQAQTRPALVRSVDEPARVPYGGTLTPACTFTNQCLAEYPVVPAGKRLRVSAVAAFLRSNTASGSHLLALHRNDASGGNILTMVLMPPQQAAYYGPIASATQLVDLIFEAGERPILEVGQSAGLGGITASNVRLTLTGYLVDVAP